MQVPVAPRTPLDGAAPSPHAAVIEQAKGLLMLEYAVSSATAFEMIRKWSRDGNHKVRDVCARLVEAVSAPAETEPTTAPRTGLDDAVAALGASAARTRTARQQRPAGLDR